MLIQKAVEAIFAGEECEDRPAERRLRGRPEKDLPRTAAAASPVRPGSFRGASRQRLRGNLCLTYERSSGNAKAGQASPRNQGDLFACRARPIRVSALDGQLRNAAIINGLSPVHESGLAND